MTTICHEIRAAEQEVLGGLLLNPEKIDIVKARLKPENFIYEDHKLILHTLVDMSVAGIRIEIRTLWHILERSGSLSTVGGFAYLKHLCKVAAEREMGLA